MFIVGGRALNGGGPQGTVLNQTPNTHEQSSGVRLWALRFISLKGNSPDRNLRSLNIC